MITAIHLPEILAELCEGDECRHLSRRLPDAAEFAWRERKRFDFAACRSGTRHLIKFRGSLPQVGNPAPGDAPQEEHYLSDLIIGALFETALSVRDERYIGSLQLGLQQLSVPHSVT
jgi:hypothetical protein